MASASECKSAKSSAMKPLCISAAVKVLLKPLGYFDDGRNGKFSFPNEVDGGLNSIYSHEGADDLGNTLVVMATEDEKTATARLGRALAALLETRIDIGLALYDIHVALLDRAKITADDRKKLQINWWRDWAKHEHKDECAGAKYKDKDWAREAVNDHIRASLVCLTPEDEGCFLKNMRKFCGHRVEEAIKLPLFPFLYTPQPEGLIDIGIIGAASNFVDIHTYATEADGETFRHDADGKRIMIDKDEAARRTRVENVTLSVDEVKRIADPNAKPSGVDTPLVAGLLKLRAVFMTHDRPMRAYSTACRQVDQAINEAYDQVMADESEDDKMKV